MVKTINSLVISNASGFKNPDFLHGIISVYTKETGAQFAKVTKDRKVTYDLTQEDLTELIDVGLDTPMILHPGEFLLGSTTERIMLPDDLVGRLDGKSSLGRLGLVIHSTAGFIDAGWDGHITLELSNVANLPITLYTGMKIGQISFFQMTTPADNPYGASVLGSKYKGQRGPTASRYSENFKKN